MKVMLHTLEEIQYNKEQKTLRVQRGDSESVYYHVPIFLYHELLMAEKPFHYIRKHIHGSFHCEQIERSECEHPTDESSHE